MYLLDTNVVSEVWRPAPDPSVAAWLRGADARHVHISVLALGELRHGVELVRRRDQRQADALARRLATIESEYADRTVPVTATIADQWGRLGIPDPLPTVDALQAATALVHDWTLVTRNVRDFERTGVRLLNPFSS